MNMEHKQLSLKLHDEQIILELTSRKFKEIDSITINEIRESDSSLEEMSANLIKKLPDDVSDFLKDELMKVLINHKKIYATSPGLIAGYSYKLKPTDDTPFFQKNYPIPFYKKHLVDEEIKQLIADDIIELCNSPYISPLVCVNKADGKSIRLCTDGRFLNKRLLPDYEQTTLIEDIFRHCHNNVVFSTVDLVKSFYQVNLHEESRPLTAFLYEGRAYQFKRVPFGLKISTAALNRALNSILGDLKPHVQTYVDDILLVSNNYESHIKLIEEVFYRLQFSNITINLRKSKLFRKELNFVGYLLTPKGISPQPDKLKVIKEAKSPTNKKELKSFLGMTNYYQKFTKEYSNKIAKLNRLLKQNIAWYWSQEEEELFQEVKKLFIENVILNFPDFSKRFYLQTDSSDVALGAQLYQVIDGERRVVQFASRILRGAELYYTITEKEFLAVVWSVKKFITYLSGCPFVIQTDHQALKFINSCKTPTARIHRWILFMQQFDFEIEYLKGAENTVADYLSRYCHDQKCNLTQNRFEMNQMEKKDLDQLRTIISQFPENYAEISKKCGDKNVENLYLKGKLLFKKDITRGFDRIVVPKGFHQELIAFLHRTHGHIGIQKTFHLVNELFIENLRQLTYDVVRKCAVCQFCKITNHVLHDEYVYFAHEYPLQVVYMDFMGPLPNGPANHKFILTIVDGFSRFTRLFAITSATTRLALKSLEKYVEAHGLPEMVVTDNGTQFTSVAWHERLMELGIQPVLTSIRHSQSNKAERVHRDIGEYMRTILADKKQTLWSRKLDVVEFLINNTYHYSLDGCPVEVFSGHRSSMLFEGLLTEEFGLDKEIKLTDEKLTEIREKTIARGRNIGENNKAKYEEKYTFTKFTKGDLVLVRSLRIPDHKGQISKFLPYWEGPYEINEIKGNGSYVLIDTKKKKIRGKFHVNLLKPYIGEV